MHLWGSYNTCIQENIILTCGTLLSGDLYNITTFKNLQGKVNTVNARLKNKDT